MNEIELKTQLLGSPLLFTQYFFKRITGKDFFMSKPSGRDPHSITLCKALKKVFRLNELFLAINLPYGHSKTTHLVYWIAWCYANYPDCNFIYVSYGSGVATDATYNVRLILEDPIYRKLFGVSLSPDNNAKDDFRTTAGGRIKAFGSAGGITGHNAGLPNLDRFSGAIIVDDPLKPDEAFSPSIRENVWSNYMNTLRQRRRGPNVPLIMLGQRLHEEDPFGHIYAGKDGDPWQSLSLPAEDDYGNILDPTKTPREFLDNERKNNPYAYWAQLQQQPQAPGGSIFKEGWFKTLEIEPQIISTFITADTAETAQSYNDATVFSFWGIYRIMQAGVETSLYALHWLDCLEIRVEPKDLESEFMAFYADCMRYPVQPMMAAIEKKSTGVTLCSVLSRLQGLTIFEMSRTSQEYGRITNKLQRYMDIQQYAASGRITFPVGAKHQDMCIKHMGLITANGAHRHDDIADTFEMAVKLALVDKIALGAMSKKQGDPALASRIMSYNKGLQQVRAGNKWAKF